jgi:hypothetical protein
MNDLLCPLSEPGSVMFVGGSAIAPPASLFKINWKSFLQPVALMTGDIGDSGYIAMTITSQSDSGNPVRHAVGQMMFLEGQWRMLCR